MGSEEPPISFSICIQPERFRHQPLAGQFGSSKEITPTRISEPQALRKSSRDLRA